MEGKGGKKKKKHRGRLWDNSSHLLPAVRPHEARWKHHLGFVHRGLCHDAPARALCFFIVKKLAPWNDALPLCVCARQGPSSLFAFFPSKK